MAGETTPASVFAAEPDLAAVVAAVRSLPGVVRCEPDGPDSAWRSIQVAIDDERGRRELLVQQDPEFWSEPSISEQVRVMRGFYGRLANDRRGGPRLEALDMIGFAVSISGDAGQPDPYLNDGDPAARLLRAITEALDGIVFSDMSFFDTQWRMLLGPEVDPEATPPTWMPDPPDDGRVARRLLVLTALYLRSDLERLEDPVADRDGWRERLLAWAREGDAWGELEPLEAEQLLAPIGASDAQTKLDMEWRIEGAAVLAWALGLLPSPSDDMLAEPADLVAAIGGLDEPPAALVGDASVRSDAELVAAQRHLFFWHWRFVDHRVNPRHFDFGSFGATAWFGGFGPNEFRLIDGDLAIADRPVNQTEPAAIGTFASAAMERHVAINWLRAGRLYSETSQDT